MKRVLFIESGKFGGGSFVSLKKHIQALDLTRITQVVIFFNQNDLISEFRAKGIKVHLLSDPVFTNMGSFCIYLLMLFLWKGM